MNENMNFGPQPKKDQESANNPLEKKIFTVPNEEETQKLKDWLEIYPDEEIPMEMRRNYEKEKAEIEILFNEFEKVHSLESLNFIINPTPEDAENYKIRTAAKNDLIPIVTLLNALKRETNISEPEHDKLNAKYRILSRAVGMVNGGKIDHTR